MRVEFFSVKLIVNHIYARWFFWRLLRVFFAPMLGNSRAFIFSCFVCLIRGCVIFSNLRCAATIWLNQHCYLAISSFYMQPPVFLEVLHYTIRIDDVSYGWSCDYVCSAWGSSLCSHVATVTATRPRWSLMFLYAKWISSLQFNTALTVTLMINWQNFLGLSRFLDDLSLHARRLLALFFPTAHLAFLGIV